MSPLLSGLFGLGALGRLLGIVARGPIIGWITIVREIPLQRPAAATAGGRQGQRHGGLLATAPPWLEHEPPVKAGLPSEIKPAVLLLTKLHIVKTFLPHWSRGKFWSTTLNWLWSTLDSWRLSAKCSRTFGGNPFGKFNFGIAQNFISAISHGLQSLGRYPSTSPSVHL